MLLLSKTCFLIVKNDVNLANYGKNYDNTYNEINNLAN